MSARVLANILADSGIDLADDRALLVLLTGSSRCLGGTRGISAARMAAEEIRADRRWRRRACLKRFETERRLAKLQRELEHKP
jgi:hypothetical protein